MILRTFEFANWESSLSPSFLLSFFPPFFPSFLFEMRVRGSYYVA
jgi:hypothetical protein